MNECTVSGSGHSSSYFLERCADTDFKVFCYFWLFLWYSSKYSTADRGLVFSLLFICL